MDFTDHNGGGVEEVSERLEKWVKLLPHHLCAERVSSTANIRVFWRVCRLTGYVLTHQPFNRSTWKHCLWFANKCALFSEFLKELCQKFSSNISTWTKCRSIICLSFLQIEHGIFFREWYKFASFILQPSDLKVNLTFFLGTSNT